MADLAVNVVKGNLSPNPVLQSLETTVDYVSAVKSSGSLIKLLGKGILNSDDRTELWKYMGVLDKALVVLGIDHDSEKFNEVCSNLRDATNYRVEERALVYDSALELVVSIQSRLLQLPYQQSEKHPL